MKNKFKTFAESYHFSEILRKPMEFINSKFGTNKETTQIQSDDSDKKTTIGKRSLRKLKKTTEHEEKPSDLSNKDANLCHVSHLVKSKLATELMSIKDQEIIAEKEQQLQKLQKKHEKMLSEYARLVDELESSQKPEVQVEEEEITEKVEELNNPRTNNEKFMDYVLFLMIAFCVFLMKEFVLS